MGFVDEVCSRSEKKGGGRGRWDGRRLGRAVGPDQENDSNGMERWNRLPDELFQRRRRRACPPSAHPASLMGVSDRSQEKRRSQLPECVAGRRCKGMRRRSTIRAGEGSRWWVTWTLGTWERPGRGWELAGGMVFQDENADAKCRTPHGGSWVWLQRRSAFAVCYGVGGRLCGQALRCKQVHRVGGLLSDQDGRGVGAGWWAT
ncbi:hypothetical protein B0T16DRAFT_181112 [Cercophora newfieldiana]|uniref:Uncharacterized protein n=1 Tax=Cercophora newfieldiana TaxID=92897 RepID=A0AA39Y0B8_9PEZI|nr:hypothetical protein B0T16DRAFT_181112 [Cercophora newfieldiana]